MTSAGLVRQTAGPQTFTAVAPIARGQVVEGRAGGIPDGGSWGPVGPAGNGSGNVIGVALKAAAPAGTYDPAGQPLDVAHIVGVPPEVPVAVAPATVAVTFNAATSFGQLVMAGPNGTVTPVASVSGASEVQTVTISGTPTGGTFTLTFAGQTTDAIAFDAASSAVQAALVALSNIGTGNVTASGSAGGPYTVTFAGDLAKEDVPQLTADATELTGGTDPAVTVATSTAGSGAGGAIGRCLEGNGVAADGVGFVKLI